MVETPIQGHEVFCFTQSAQRSKARKVENTSNIKPLNQRSDLNLSPLMIGEFSFEYSEKQNVNEEKSQDSFYVLTLIFALTFSTPTTSLLL